MSMNPKYQKLENEDSYEYGLRLIELKVEQNPSDLEWSDIVDLLGLNVHYDSLRKAANVTPYSGYNVMKHFKAKMASGELSGSTYMDELDKKMLEFKMERQRFFDQRNALNKVVRGLARGEENYVILERAIMNGALPQLSYISAMELVNPNIPSMAEAAILAKMGDRGQLGNVIVDGPLSLDIALYKEVAEHKKIKGSAVAGDADCLLFPNLESGNVFFKSVSHIGGGELAAMVVGATKPCVLTSRGDSALSKKYSIALACLAAK